MPQNLTNEKSTLVQLMANLDTDLCCYVASLSQNELIIVLNLLADPDFVLLILPEVLPKIVFP